MNRLEAHPSGAGLDRDRSSAVRDPGYLPEAGRPGRQQSHRVTLCAALFLVVLLTLMMMLSCAGSPHTADQPVAGDGAPPLGRGTLSSQPGLGVRF